MPHVKPEVYLCNDEFRALLIQKARTLLAEGTKVTTRNLQQSSKGLRDSRCAVLLDYLKRTGVIVNTPGLKEVRGIHHNFKGEIQSDKKIRSLLLSAWKKDGIYPSLTSSKKVGVECTDSQFYRARSLQWMSDNGIKARLPKEELADAVKRREKPIRDTTAWFVDVYRKTWPSFWDLLKSPKISSVDVNQESA